MINQDQLFLLLAAFLVHQGADEENETEVDKLRHIDGCFVLSSLMISDYSAMHSKTQKHVHIDQISHSHAALESLFSYAF